MLRSVTPHNFSKVSTPSVSNQRQGSGTRTLTSIRQLVDQFIELDSRETNRTNSFIRSQRQSIYELKNLIKDCKIILIQLGGLTPEQARYRLNGLQKKDPRIPLLTEMSTPGFNIETLKTGYSELYRRVSELDLQLLRELSGIKK